VSSLQPFGRSSHQPSSGPAPVALLGVAEAAHRLGISRTTLYGEIGTSRVRSIKIGSRREIPADAIAEYVRRAQGE